MTSGLLQLHKIAPRQKLVISIALEAGGALVTTRR
jgi:hypothetical protein